MTPFLENDAVLGDIDEHFAGNYLDEDTILKAARAQGFSTAAIGKLGPALIFDHTDAQPAETHHHRRRLDRQRRRRAAFAGDAGSADQGRACR